MMKKFARCVTSPAGISRRAGAAMAAALFVMSLTISTVGSAVPVVEPADAAALNWRAADIEHFLLTAKVVHSEPIAGVEGAARATLSNGTTTHDALVRTVEAYEYRWAPIRDSYRYNLAAYRLDKMLGLGVVPVTLERQIGGQMASVTWWQEDTGADNRNADFAAFRQLVYAPSATASNLPDTVSRADYTQAFALCDELPNPRNLAPVSREFYNRIRALDRRDVASQLASLLSKQEIECLWNRRHELLATAKPKITRAGPVERSAASIRSLLHHRTRISWIKTITLVRQ